MLRYWFYVLKMLLSPTPEQESETAAVKSRRRSTYWGKTVAVDPFPAKGAASPDDPARAAGGTGAKRIVTICTNCGSSVERNAKICFRCGFEVGSAGSARPR